MAACLTNNVEARNLPLETSPPYQPLRELASNGFTGTVADLHAQLESIIDDNLRRSER
jgi:hypothetical protein